MQIFYAPDIIGDRYTLDEKESKHSVRVLRMKKGAPVRLIDGKGNLYEGVITDPDPSGCSVEILNVINDFEKREYNLHIAISPLKNPERFEWFVGKSVEIGIDEITPLICRNTEKPGIKQDRINNLIISSMKQSLKARMSILNAPCLFSNFITREREGILMMACCGSNINRRWIGDVCKKGERCSDPDRAGR